MLLMISLITVIGHVPNSILSVFPTFNLLNYTEHQLALLFGNFFLFLSHSSYFFIYYLFNPVFKKKFLGLFRKREANNL